MTLAALGVSGILRGDFTAIWQPVPEGLPAREALAYVCALVALAAGAGLPCRRSAPTAALALTAWLLLWLLLFKGRLVWLAPADAASWEACGETAVLLAAAWVLHAQISDGRRLGFAAGDAGLHTARSIYSLALVAFGIAHLAYVKETAALVPAWLPSPASWVYLTGCTYIAAGAAALVGIWARLAATLSAVQIGSFTLLVWVPPLAAGSKDAGQWSEAVISWALTAGAWVVAESYRGTPWHAVGKR
ncbi:MAG TPA: hypothetical protein VKS60_17000 [Stellaceae bacterium]|nr:hypothetical protein [Stellaceae bacterium]